MERKPIVERAFQAAGKDLVCRLFAPVAEEIGFRCSYEIAASDAPCARGDAMGEDGVQALLNAMAKVRTRLEAWPTRVTWLGSEHLGLPGLDSVLNVFTPEGRWFSYEGNG